MQTRNLTTLLLAAAICASAAVPAIAKKSAPTDKAASTKTEAAAPLTVTVDEAGTCKTLKQGGTATVAVKTEPSVKGTITVKLKSGSSQNAALAPQKAGADGVIKWTWKVAKNTAPGPISWTVAVKDKKRQAETSGTITVEAAAAAADTAKVKPAAEGKGTKAPTGKGK